MRRRHELVIRRDDHKRDSLGAVFLGAVVDECEIRDYLERYLGPTIAVKSACLDEAVLRLEVECPRFEAESQNLMRLGRSLFERGRTRAATDMFEEALRLDPLNVDALKAEASIRAVNGDFSGAHDRWVRAGEIRGYDGEILRGLANVAFREDRRPSAMRYLEEALIVNPEDYESRQILEEMRRQVELAFRDMVQPQEVPRRREGDE